jgi:predicted nucleic acid-binding protein
LVVADSSAVVAALVVRDPPAGLVERLSAGRELHVPHLLDVEVLHALRRLTRFGDLGDDRAQDARGDFAQLALIRYPHVPLADRAWALRHNLSAYDAAFVALAEALEMPLVTCDGRLARATGHQATVELFAP